jgi:hypothetical protein
MAQLSYSELAQSGKASGIIRCMTAKSICVAESELRLENGWLTVIEQDGFDCKFFCAVRQRGVRHTSQ